MHTKNPTPTDPSFAHAVKTGLDQTAQVRAMGALWRSLLNDIREKHGEIAVRAIQDEVDRRQRELDVESLRRRM